MKFTLRFLLAIAWALPTAMAQSPVLITAFTNPVPSKDDLFGRSVAALGNDRVLTGAPGRSSSYTNPAVYLFTTTGELLTTFTNPAPNDTVFYGQSVAGVGTDRVLIGTYQSGFSSGRQRAFLFSTNGQLVTTLTPPPGSGGTTFGQAVAALGTDRLLIGAPGDDPAPGRVHLFSTNGEALTAFTYPGPPVGGGFGGSLAALGNDRVLVGHPGDNIGATGAGSVYLFSTNGTLLTTITNPTPAANDFFGSSVAAVGSDRVLIGATGDDTAATNAGAAYLFWTNGVLLATFTNPSPAYSSRGFGAAVAAVGSDRVLISAPGIDAPDGTQRAGTAYLFSINGTLLATLPNPVPTVGGGFGAAVAAVGSDRVLIGAAAGGLGATNAGSAYLFSIPPPPLLSTRLMVSNTVAVSWPSDLTGFVLQQNTTALGSLTWSNVTDTIQDNGTNRFVIVDPAVGNRFYRLVKP